MAYARPFLVWGAYLPPVLKSGLIYGIVKSRYEGDIVFITRSRGGAEAEGNKNDITRVDGI